MDGNSLYSNEGSTFSTLPYWQAQQDFVAYSVALGDVDGDGDLDLVCGNGYDGATGRRNTLHLNDRGIFSSTPDWSSEPQNYTRSLALGDVDGDGDLDLVCGNSDQFPDGHNNTLYLNEGGIFSTTPVWSSGPLNFTNSVALGDVNGDGDLDLVCGNGGSNTLYLNQSGLFSTTPAWVSGPGNTTTAVALGDVDGDGDLDLVCGNSGVNTLYLNEGGIFASSPIWSSVPSNSTSGIALGDIDGDGDLDFLCGNNYGQNNTVYMNIGGIFSTTPDWSSGLANSTMGIALADVNGDGGLDLVCGNYVQSNTCYLNLGKILTTVPVWTVAGNITQSVALEDVDGDRDVDLICGSNGQNNALYLNQNGVFITPPAWSSGPANSTNDLGFGDVDGDGDLDLVCGNSGKNTLYLNGGMLFSTTPAWLSDPANDTHSVELGDVDGDGDLDLVCGNSGRNTLYLNDGALFSTIPTWLSDPANDTRSVELGDVDDDGDLDLVCGNWGSNTLYLNAGGVLSATPDWSSGPGNATHSVALGDIDGDGDPDLVCGNYSVSKTMYLNQGGVFSILPDWSGPTNYTRSIALGDMDRDGDLDLVCGNSNGGESNTILLNENGAFSSTPFWSGPGYHTFSVALGDVEGDGDLDLVVGNDLQNTTLYESPKNPPYKGDPLVPTNHLPNNGAYLRFVNVQQTAVNVHRISATVVDLESDSVWIIPEYKYEGALDWNPVDIVGQQTKIGPLPSSPDGIEHQFDWGTSSLLLFDRRNVILRLRTVSNPRRVALIQHASNYHKDVGPIEVFRPMIELSLATLSFPTVTVGDTIPLVLTFSNDGNLLLNISNITLPSAEMRLDLSAPFSIDPGDSVNITVFLEPRLQTSISGDLVIESNDPQNLFTFIPLSTDIRALEVSTRLLAPAPEVPLGDALTVIITAAPEVHVESGFLYHRPSIIGGTFVDSVSLHKSADDFIAIIPGNHVVEGGVDYYVKVENSGVYATDPPGAPDDSVFFQAVESPTSISSTPIPNEGPDYLEGLDIRVQVSLAVGAIFQEGSLHFRQGGEETGDSASLQLGDPLPFAMIPDTLVGARGVEYWVKVVTLTDTLCDPPSQPDQSPRTIRVLVQDLKEARKHSAAQYRMMSIPLAMEGTINGALTDNIGGQDKTRWRMFTYDVDDSAYVEVPNDTVFSFEQGRGYWLITKDPHWLDTGPARGRSTPTDSFFAVTLHPGWNMIGDPFAFAIAWDSCVVDTLAMANAEGIVVEPPVRWIGSSYQYDVGTLEPFDGYWVKNLTDTIVTLKLPPREDPAVMAETIPVIFAGLPDGCWQIEIHAFSCGLADGHNVIGMAQGAATEWDKHDRSEPPLSPGKAISLYFPHVSWKQHPDHYTVDIRGQYVGLDKALTALASENGDLWGHIWQFDVAKSFSDEPAGDEVVLEFQGIQRAPSSAKLYLIDRRLQHAIDLREEGQYTFFEKKKAFISKEDDARFVLLVGSEEFIESKRDQLPELPTETALYQNYPNPFNPSTAIRYDVARAGNVAVKIYDVRGSLVKILLVTYKNPGRYEVGWDGDNEGGQRVSSGIYFCMMETSSGFRATRKMLLLK
ncbi:MAG: hypothetical protein GTO42_08905 [Candidatus Latescibacteria bacterium]|nr:hypothetical protein [Candidatus Latescibacterota bacterium]NIO29080.1 hypothetical protein [Candidatus Latescibacterota bacterium]NIO56705.1 hypothetical protein [Candidatus Latescibacterota bacterium]NIT02288.1 hypothetical protein [Candidatus Latescibacterota bacterium]NIT39173.1 hypothetical protein [Candidatus Latescibacterota bacterium]